MASYSSTSSPTSTMSRTGAPGRTMFKKAPTGAYAPSSPSTAQKQYSRFISKRDKVNLKKLKKRLGMNAVPFASEEENRLIMNFSGYSIQNKKIQNINILPQSARIQYGLDILEQNGVMPTEEFNLSPNQLAERFLFGINCTLSKEGSSFSLLNDQADSESIQNPNIFDELEFKNLKPDYLKVPFCFSDECNPFYNLDDRSTKYHRSLIKAAGQLSNPLLLRVASENAQMNLRSKENKRLRYFKNSAELRKRNKF